MPPRLHLVRSIRANQFASGHSGPLCLRLAPRRHITADEKALPKTSSPGPGPNQEQLPHVSEEAAMTGKIIGGGGPDIEQGTPIQEVLKRDEDSQKSAPEVIKEDLKSSAPKGSRSYSTLARMQQEAMISFEDDSIVTQGHKFGLPELPLKTGSHIKHRYDPIVRQVTNLLMKDGKLSQAQRNMGIILNHLRTSPPPSVDPERPLVPGAPPSSHLPLNPVLYLTLAIDSIAPLVRIRAQKGYAGGGAALQIPIPLGLQARRRQAIMWIIDSASKKRFRGSGKGQFAQKVGEELVSIVEGRSSIWEKRHGVHRLGVAARSNIPSRRRR